MDVLGEGADGHRFESTRGLLARCAVCGRTLALSRAFACSLCQCTVHRACLQQPLPACRQRTQQTQAQQRSDEALGPVSLADDAVILRGALWKRSRKRPALLKQVLRASFILAARLTAQWGGAEVLCAAAR